LVHSPPPATRFADPGCLSRILDPDFYPSRISIPDPTTTKEEGKKLDVLPFFVATNFSKLKIILFLSGIEKKFEPIDNFFLPK
jgi:hypothetical protein